jgi:hypothetical protein
VSEIFHYKYDKGRKTLYMTYSDPNGGWGSEDAMKVIVSKEECITSKNNAKANLVRSAFANFFNIIDYYFNSTISSISTGAL